MGISIGSGSGRPKGPATGDLSGNYPNPTIAGAHGLAPGQIAVANEAGACQAVTMSGDGTMSATGKLSVPGFLHPTPVLYGSTRTPETATPGPFIFSSETGKTFGFAISNAGALTVPLWRCNLTDWAVSGRTPKLRLDGTWLGKIEATTKILVIRCGFSAGNLTNAGVQGELSQGELAEATANLTANFAMPESSGLYTFGLTTSKSPASVNNLIYAKLSVYYE